MCVVSRARLKLSFTLSAATVEGFRLPELAASDDYIVSKLVLPRLGELNDETNQRRLSQYLVKQERESARIVVYWKDLVACVTNYYDGVWLERELPAAALVQWLDTKWLASALELQADVLGIGASIEKCVTRKRECSVGFAYAEADEINVQRDFLFRALSKLLTYVTDMTRTHLHNVWVEREHHPYSDSALRAAWAELEKKGKS
jgi:hypothetical protein